MDLLKQQKIKSWLIKQRDGLIIGDYRNQLFYLYKGIELLSRKNSGICEANQLQKHFTNTIFENINILLEYATMLKELEYIDLYRKDGSIYFIIKRDIDF